MPRRGEGRIIEADGKALTVIQWATWRGWDVGTIRTRLSKGWDPVRAVTEASRPDMRGTDRNYAEVRRERRRMRAEAGLCIHCALPVESGKTQCRKHLDAARKSMGALQTARRELGICLRCDEPVQPGFTTCEAHGEYSRDLQADVRAHHQSIGICIKCSKRVAPGHVMCRAHLAGKHQEWIDAGKERRAAISEERRACGVCTTCGERRAVKGSQLCKEHLAEARARLGALRRKQVAAKKGTAPKGAEAIRPGVIKRRKADSG